MLESLSLRLVETFLDYAPRAPFFVKNRALEYVAANSAMARLCGVARNTDLIGRSARDFFPQASRDRYEALDRQVIRHKKPIKDLLELVAPRRSAPVWLLFGRWPVLGPSGAAIGVVAIARNLDSPDRRHPAYQRLALVISHLQENFDRPLNVASLALRAGTSISQLERDFTGLFGVSPRRYLTKVRLDAALEMLRGEADIAQIAHACGYADQSAFTRRFRETVGEPPTAYRRAKRSQDKI